MFLNNNDMYLLNEIASVLKIDRGRLSKSSVEEFIELVEKLETQKRKKITNSRDYIKTKRLQDKTYARTYEEKNKMLGL